MDLAKQLGSAVKQRRAELGISQEELAHRAGVNRAYMSDVELGKYNVTLKTIQKLATALEISVTELFSMVEGSG